MTNRAVAYYRTSSKTNSGENKDSERRQKSACHKYAVANGIAIVDEFYDAGVQGKDSLNDREGFNRLLAFCGREGITSILVQDASRFARDLIVQELGYRMLTDAGFLLTATDSPDTFTDDSPTTKLIRQVLGAVAEHSKDELVAKMRGARFRQAQINKERGITTLSGAGKCGGRKSWAEMDANLVALARSLRRKSRKTHKRMSYNKIATELFEKGYKTNTGKKFDGAQIQRMTA